MLQEIAPFKPVLTALALPPVPLLVLMLIGTRLILPRRGLGWFLVLLSVSLLWMSFCSGTGAWLHHFVLRTPAALSDKDLERLQLAGKSRNPEIAILVLGGGRVEFAPEYGISDLSPNSAERLRYAIWLARQTNLPVGFSGGLGWAEYRGGRSEAEIAADVTQRIYGRSLKWTETGSRDTQGNAALSVPMLRQAGIREIVLVTHGWHMPRSLTHFTRYAGSDIRITPAPMGYFDKNPWGPRAWIPSDQGYSQVRLALRELLGMAVGA